MSDIQAPKQSTPIDDPFAAISGGASALTVFLIFLVGAAATLAFLSAQSAEPFVLTIMGLLATLGVFFVFGVAAGHIRVSERASGSDLAVVLADHLDQAALIVAPDGRILHANRTAAPLMGRNELGDLNTLEEAFATSQPGAEALFRLVRAAQRGRVHSEDMAIDAGAGVAAGTGPQRWYRVAVKPFGRIDIPEYAGRAALWTITDISIDRRELDVQRRALETDLAHFAEMPAGLLAISAQGQVSFMNAKVMAWLGYDAPNVVQPQGLAEIAARSDAEYIMSHARSGEPCLDTVDVDLITAGGERWPATCVISRDDDASPDKEGVTLLVLEREGQATEDGAADEAEAQFQQLFKTAPFGIALVDRDGRLTNVNSAFKRLMGHRSRSVTGTALDFMAEKADPQDLPVLRQALESAALGKAEIPALEIAVGADGEFTRRLYVQSFGKPSRKRHAAILYVTDATEERALGQKFAQSQKMEAVGKLAGGIAHDFNNVLTAIIGFSDLLLASHRPTDLAFKNIQNIRSSANHAASLVKQLLAFSRRQTLEPEVLQLNELVTDLSVILNRLLGERIELKISSGRELWPVKADHSQINQVVMNLAVNARDAMAEGGRLTIRTRNVTERESQRHTEQGLQIGEYVMIEVEDTGIGMPEDVVAKIFEPFFTTKDVGKGTGLGLSTVYGVVKQTGGYVFAESAVGEGTVFRVYLPRHHSDDLEDIEPRKTAKKEPAVDLTGHGRVLVVEDEDAVRIFATEALRRQGYDVLQACDGLEALDIMEEHDHQVDLVVSDVKMPEMDGPTLFKELRRHNPDLKFVFVSGYTDDAFATTLDAEAEYTFLPKPYTLAQIAEVVKDQLQT